MQPPTDDTRSADARAGQCGRCAQVRRVRSARGSTFYLCRRADGDAAFARYPNLPMAGCPGFTPAPLDGAAVREA